MKMNWTKAKAELERLAVQMMWSEERIRELMSAARLREVNWDKQTPAERGLRIYICWDEKSKKFN